MERSGNFYKAIRLGYILISIVIGCMAYNSLYEWQEIEALELGNNFLVACSYCLSLFVAKLAIIKGLNKNKIIV